MSTVIAFALFVNFVNGPVLLGGLPDRAECERIGLLLQPDATKRACLSYRMIVNGDVLTPH
jgi:hypothetical protein